MMIAQGDIVTITHQIVVDGQVAFGANDVAFVEAISPNPQRPEQKYVVFSTKVHKRFQLSDADVRAMVSTPRKASRTASASPGAPAVRRPSRNGVIAAVGLLTMLLVIGGSYFGLHRVSVKNSPAPVTQNTGSPNSTKPTAVPGNQGTISMAEFDTIQDGMSYEQVVQIVGGPGEKLSETGSPGASYYTVIYKWDGEGSTGANAVCEFQNGALVTKMQFGLQ